MQKEKEKQQHHPTEGGDQQKRPRERQRKIIDCVDFQEGQWLKRPRKQKLIECFCLPGRSTAQAFMTFGAVWCGRGLGRFIVVHFEVTSWKVNSVSTKHKIMNQMLLNAVESQRRRGPEMK